MSYDLTLWPHKETFQVPPEHSEQAHPRPPHPPGAPPQPPLPTTTTATIAIATTKRNHTSAKIFSPLFVCVCWSRLVHSRAKGFTVSSVAGETRSKPNTLHIRAERRADLIMCNKSVVHRRQKPNVCFSRSVNSGRRLSLETGSRPGLCGLESDQSRPSPAAPWGSQGCGTMQWQVLAFSWREDHEKRNILFPLSCAQLGQFVGAYFMDYGAFFVQQLNLMVFASVFC